MQMRLRRFHPFSEQFVFGIPVDAIAIDLDIRCRFDQFRTTGIQSFFHRIRHLREKHEKFGRCWRIQLFRYVALQEFKKLKQKTVEIFFKKFTLSKEAM